MSFGWTDREAMLRRRAAMSPEETARLEAECERVPSCAMCDVLPSWESVCDDRPGLGPVSPMVLLGLSVGFGALAFFLEKARVA